MVAANHEAKVRRVVVEDVVVNVMDMAAVRDRSVVVLPDLSVQPNRALRPNAFVGALVVATSIGVPTLSAPFNAFIAHSTSPSRT